METKVLLHGSAVFLVNVMMAFSTFTLKKHSDVMNELYSKALRKKGTTCALRVSL